MRGSRTKRTPVRVSKRSGRARAARCLFAHSRPTPRGGATIGVTYYARQEHEAHAHAAARLKTVCACTCSALPVCVHGAVCIFTAYSPRRSDDRSHLQCAAGARSARPRSRASQNGLCVHVQRTACLRAWGCLHIHGLLPAAERRPESLTMRGRSTKRTPVQPRVSKRSGCAHAAHCLFACMGLFAHSRPTPRGGATTGVICNARQEHEAHARAAARPKTIWAHKCRALPVCVPEDVLLIHGRIPGAERRPESFAKLGSSTMRTPVQTRA